MQNYSCDRPLIRAMLKMKRTSVGDTTQQDIDMRFRRHEADKFATPPRLRAEGKTVSDRRSVAQTDRRTGERTLVETRRGVSDEWQSYLLPDSVHLNTHICLCKTITKT